MKTKSCKKIMVALVAVIGLTIGAQAQMCQTTGNVQPDITTCSGGQDEASVNLTNYNNYTVDVTATVTIVWKSGEKKTIQRQFVIQPGKYANISCISSPNVSDKSNVNLDACTVRLNVLKCSTN